MKLSMEHIDSPGFSFQKLVYLQVAEKLDSRLMPILLEEISLGNRIYEAGANDDGLRVCLRHPFKGTYGLSKGVQYREERDPHYNTAEYVADGPSPHVLSAPFKK